MTSMIVSNINSVTFAPSFHRLEMYLPSLLHSSSAKQGIFQILYPFISLDIINIMCFSREQEDWQKDNNNDR
jgi:hypothetical protein